MLDANERLKRVQGEIEKLGAEMREAWKESKAGSSDWRKTQFAQRYAELRSKIVEAQEARAELLRELNLDQEEVYGR